MKKFGCLLFLAAILSTSAFAAAIQLTRTDSEDTNFEAPGLIHCEVGHTCTFTPSTSTACEAGQPVLLHCQVGKECTHTCSSSTAVNAVKGNRKAASVPNQ